MLCVQGQGAARDENLLQIWGQPDAPVIMLRTAGGLDCLFSGQARLQSDY